MRTKAKLVTGDINEGSEISISGHRMVANTDVT